MRDTVLTLAFADDEGRPDGGISDGPGFTVSWQRGPLVLPDGTELPRNGAFVEEVLGACRDRLVTYQDSPFTRSAGPRTPGPPAGSCRPYTCSIA